MLQTSLKLSRVDMVDGNGQLLAVDVIVAATGYADDIANAPLARPLHGRSAVSQLHHFVACLRAEESSEIDGLSANDIMGARGQVAHTQLMYASLF